MNSNMRGLVIFAVIIVVAWFFCAFVPGLMMGWNISMALPVIQMPGEIYQAGWPSEGFVFTNTLAGTLLADAVVLLIALFAFRASKGWTNEIPGRFQGIMESIVGALYGFVKDMAGTTRVVRTQLFPLVASLFFFLLIANWLELVPGVDSIGITHCAHPGQTGYAASNDGRWLGFDTLYNNEALFVGYGVETDDHYYTCKKVLHGDIVVDTNYDAATATQIDEIAAQLNVEETELSSDEVSALQYEYSELTGYKMATVYVDSEALQNGIVPYVHVITPFIRAAATDLNLTFGLAIISIIAIQYFGMAALGFGYWKKFVNIEALGNAGKRPMGIMDFGVGLFEIISEFAKMISLAFRLFGNIFAGQLLIFIITFLVATLLPVAVYGLELAVGFIQALVFGILTLVFSAQAMVSHDHDDHAEDHH